MTRAEHIAIEFHNVYEELAPKAGWTACGSAPASWEEVPEPNRRLMIETVTKLLEQGVIRPGVVRRVGEQSLECPRCDDVRRLAQSRHDADDLFDVLTQIHKVVHPENFDGKAKLY